MNTENINHPMENYKLYGNQPPAVVLVHGGPGAAGELSPVALELSLDFGVVEALQTKLSIDEQIEELHETVQKTCTEPIVLIGHSWGAWLACLFSSKYQNLISKLVLIGAGAFDEKYIEGMTDQRFSKLSQEEIKEIGQLQSILKPELTNKSIRAFKRFGEIMSKVDSYDLVDGGTINIDYRPDIFFSVWNEASNRRKNGALLKSCSNITCPVFAIHGKDDPHPYKGVFEPLTEIIPEFQSILLDKCGHSPWKEKYAKQIFYNHVKKIITGLK